MGPMSTKGREMGAGARPVGAGARARGARLAPGLCLAIAALGLLAGPASAAAPPFLTQVPEDGDPGPGAGRMDYPWGVAADPNLPGHVYVADRKNARIDEFTAWGEFVKAWGWGVLDGADALQVCTTDCEAGKPGGGAGQLSNPEAVAVNNEGNVYVVEAQNHRVQKFDPSAGAEEDEVTLLLSFGETGPGELGGGFGSYLNKVVASPTTGKVFVGEGERILVFDSGGNFIEAIEEGDMTGKSVRALAPGPDGNLYAAFAGDPEAHKLAPSGPGEFLEPSFPAVDPEEQPSALAVDGAGNLYVALKDEIAIGQTLRWVREYDGEGNCLTCGEDGEGGLAGFDRSEETQIASLAASGACGSEVAYPTHFTAVAPAKSFLRAFGDPPDPELCPQPQVAPRITAQYAAGVETDSAAIGAKINPRFWEDTTYRLEYGTSPCQEGGCTESTEARALTDKVSSEVLAAGPLALEGLEPGTTYHYRFVAESGGGGPVYGIDPDGPDGSGEASFEAGLEASFTTYLPPSQEPCPNDSYRSGAGGLLPDCRAYELVSPLDKEGADIKVFGSKGSLLPAVLAQSAADGDRLAYGTYRAFGDAESAPWTSQYIAARIPGSEWQSHAISPPRGEGLYEVVDQTAPEFKAFSEDLCEGWLLTFADLPAKESGPAGISDLYRRSDEECGGPVYEPLNTAAVEPKLELELQGLSGDGESAVFIASRKLAAGGSEGGVQLYGNRGAETRFLCVRPGGGNHSGSCTAGWSPGIRYTGQDAQVANALSADGERLYWTDAGSGKGKIYLREHPFETESAHQHKAAVGTGDVAGKVAATGNLRSTQFTVKNVQYTGPGRFVVGQEIASPEGSILPGTRIEAIEEPEPGEFTLTLSAKPTAFKGGAALEGIASNVVTEAKADSGEFAPEQEIRADGEGIPPGTRIEAVAQTSSEPPRFKLTLSEPASVGGPATGLESTSPCTEPERACTLAVSAAAEAAEESGGSQFWAAAEDGSKAIFETGGALYEYRQADESTHEIVGEALGVMGQSEDLARIYLASREARGGPNAEGKEAVAGEANLYLYEGGGFRFIGALAEADLIPPKYSPVAQSLSSRFARVSEDGEHGAFMSAAPLTGYDNTDRGSGEADTEVFLYEAEGDGGAGRLVCASCNPSGARPAGEQAVVGVSGFPTAGRLLPPENVLYASRMLSADGKRLYFESYDALTLADTNGRRDVYQWEAPGKGSCKTASPSYSPRNGGCVELVSSGKSALDSGFVDASPSGDDVFFTTSSSLVGHDYGLVDVYDARVEGGLPGPPGPPKPCEGEACQSPPPAPEPVPAASLRYRGPGNLQEPAAPFARCNRAARKAKRLSRRAKALRRAKAPAARRKRLGAAGRSARKARRLSRSARRCRARARRRAGR
jgi:hypothetical protein